jgi:hypothetical protein
MSIDTQGAVGTRLTRSAAAPEAKAPSPTALVLRPVGYLSTAVVWTAISVIPFVLGYGLIPLGYLLSLVEPDSPVHWWEYMFEVDPDHRTGFVLGMVLFVGPILGFGVLGLLSFAVYPLVVLSWLAFFRSLNPRYRGDRLTFTSHEPPGTTFGPPTMSDVALSLIPTHETRFTRWVMRFYMYGWKPSGRMILGMMPAGAGLMLGVLAADVLTPAPLQLGYGAAAVALVTVSALVVRRDWKRRYFPTADDLARQKARADDGKTKDERTGRPVDELTPQERLERIRRLRAEREAQATEKDA